MEKGGGETTNFPCTLSLALPTAIEEVVASLPSSTMPYSSREISPSPLSPPPPLNPPLMHPLPGGPGFAESDKKVSNPSPLPSKRQIIPPLRDNSWRIPAPDFYAVAKWRWEEREESDGGGKLPLNDTEGRREGRRKGGSIRPATGASCYYTVSTRRRGFLCRVGRFRLDRPRAACLVYESAQGKKGEV